MDPYRDGDAASSKHLPPPPFVVVVVIIIVCPYNIFASFVRLVVPPVPHGLQSGLPQLILPLPQQLCFVQ